MRSTSLSSTIFIYLFIYLQFYPFERPGNFTSHQFFSFDIMFIHNPTSQHFQQYIPVHSINNTTRTFNNNTTRTFNNTTLHASTNNNQYHNIWKNGLIWWGKYVSDILKIYFHHKINHEVRRYIQPNILFAHYDSTNSENSGNQSFSHTNKHKKSRTVEDIKRNEIIVQRGDTWFLWNGRFTSVKELHTLLTYIMDDTAISWHVTFILPFRTWMTSHFRRKTCWDLLPEIKTKYILIYTVLVLHTSFELEPTHAWVELKQYEVSI